MKGHSISIADWQYSYPVQRGQWEYGWTHSLNHCWNSNCCLFCDCHSVGQKLRAKDFAGHISLGSISMLVYSWCLLLPQKLWQHVRIQLVAVGGLFSLHRLLYGKQQEQQHYNSDFCKVAWLLRCKVALLLRGCVIVALQSCVIVALKGCMIVALQGCVIVASQGWVIVELQGCMIVALQGYVIVALQGCVIVVLQGCVIVALQGCVIAQC
jgi:hypothetical protein